MRCNSLMLLPVVAVLGLGLPEAQAKTVLPGNTYLIGLDPGDGDADGSVRFLRNGVVTAVQLLGPSRLAVCFDHVAYPGGIRANITDGSSNTIQFGESTRFLLQPGQVTPRQSIVNIQDGSSNTIIIGEQPDDSLCLADAEVTTPIGGITDGTSNTIQLGEDSEFDVCFRGVRTGTAPFSFGDGSVRTINLGEVRTAPLCFNGVKVAIDPDAVAEPGTLAALAGGLFGLIALRRRVS